MNTSIPQTMLFTHSWFASKEYKLNNKDENSGHLSVSKASMNQASSEKFPFDMIEKTPQLENKLDPQLLSFMFISVLASSLFLTLSLTLGLTILSLFSGFFLLSAIVSFILASQNKVRSYTYFYMDSNIPMFTLTTKQADKEKVEKFVKNLDDSIKLATAEHEKVNTINPSQPTMQNENHTIDSKEQEYLGYTYHLDFLFASGLMDDESYLKVGQNISEKVFGGTQEATQKTVAETNNRSNIIHFPS